ncbi:MAG: hypothetical protein NTW20_11065 [Rhodobacterales bacterium]|nr:hypothetical protein [Rhodobacterales bacterium]
MNKPLLLAVTLGTALVAALAFAAPQGANANAASGTVMNRAAAYAMAFEG